MMTSLRSCTRYPSGGTPPIHIPFFFEAAILSRMRSPMTSRSNWAKDNRTLRVKRPTWRRMHFLVRSDNNLTLIHCGRCFAAERDSVIANDVDAHRWILLFDPAAAAGDPLTLSSPTKASLFWIISWHYWP